MPLKFSVCIIPAQGRLPLMQDWADSPEVGGGRNSSLALKEKRGLWGA